MSQPYQAPVQPSTPSSPSVKLWTPGLIAGITFLLGFPGGIVLSAINLMRMNMKNKAIAFLAGGAGGIVILTLITLFLPGNYGNFFALVVNIGVLFFLYRQAKADIESFKSSNHAVQNENELVGCLIGLATLVLYVILAFGIGFFIGIVLSILGVPLPQ